MQLAQSRVKHDICVYLLPLLTRKCEQDAKQLSSLDWITEKDDSAKNSETELGVSDHVVAAADQLACDKIPSC